MGSLPSEEKPLILVAHPRSRSSAFERVFIQNQAHVDTLHEPFGDAYWLGSERQLARYERMRDISGFTDTTYKSAMDNISREQKISHANGKRLFIKEMAFFLFPADSKCRRQASSFGALPAEPDNPTLLPYAELAKFQYTFLIRHPYYSVPSYYRLSLPERKEASCVDKMTTQDLGYSELRQLFDYLLHKGLIRQPALTALNTNATNRRTQSDVEKHATHANGSNPVCVIDAEELMKHPKETIQAYCRTNGIGFEESALQWDDNKDQKRAAAVIDKWGFSVTFHEAVLQSKGLCANKNTSDSWDRVYESWVDEFGVEGADEIKKAADLQLDDYYYLRSFIRS